MTRDLLMVPTEHTPGHYTEDGEPVMVARHNDGKNYMLLWYASGTGDAESDFDGERGDILLKDTYPTKLLHGSYSDEGVTVTAIDMTGHQPELDEP